MNEFGLAYDIHLYTGDIQITHMYAPTLASAICPSMTFYLI